MTARTNRTTEPAPVRCAIYSRKSTEEGLAQEFNSLDAQREAGEAYIKSQAQEGWRCLATRYDDGGFSGGNLERPALQRLLADIRAGGVDCVVFHKIDRLSRSLLDFARLMEVFDAHQVSFVAVTQQVSSATSMGRLMLNVLLSFAQFEREIIGERTRDKIAAAKRRGKWSGGTPVLGYDLDPTAAKLLVNEAEAAQVRAVFDLYLEHQGLLPVVQELARRGWTTKRFTTRRGEQRGGRPFDKTNLHYLLTRVLYTGKLPHKGAVHDGEHAALVDEATSQRVQELLHRGQREQRARQRSEALLAGLLYCVPCGRALTPTYASKRGRLRYRYYLCSHAQKNGHATCPTKSVPAPALERFVVEQIQALGQDAEHLQQLVATASAASAVDDDRVSELREPVEVRRILRGDWDDLPAASQAQVLRRLVQRIDYDGGSGKVRITFRPDGLAELVLPEAQL